MARLVADIPSNLYLKFKIIALREEKTIKDKLIECILNQCFDELYEIKYIDTSEISDIFADYDSVQINLIDGHMIGYSQERKPLVDEEVLLITKIDDIDDCNEDNINYEEWLCNCLDETDYARDNFIKFLPR